MLTTKTRTQTHAITIAAILVGGAGIVLALFPFFSNRGYQNFYTACYDGSYIQSSYIGGEFIDRLEMDRPAAIPGFGCQERDFFAGVAREFCQGHVSEQTGKEGVNTFKVSNRCKVTNPQSYGYGYNQVRAYTP